MTIAIEGATALAEQLRLLGYAASPIDAARLDHLSFAYVVPVGRFNGQAIRVGLISPPDFPRTPPSGPHIAPRLIAHHGGGPGGVHASAFGSDWEYWSRPYQNWGRDGRDASAYLAFLRTLFATT